MEEMHEERGKAVTTGTQNNESIWRFQEPDNILRFAEEGEVLSARITFTRPVSRESLPRLEAQDEHLFPGLSNEIVLDLIVPKLPWRAFYILSSVCVRAFCLYSVTEKTWHTLPHFSHQREAHRGIPSRCGWVSLGGKVYVLGGASEDNDTDYTDFREVYVLDLAGQTGWRQCADMLESRQNFAYGVIDGKIYVAGGTSCGKTIRRSEVYDPEENSWSSISPMISTRAHHKFVTVGKELWLYHGLIYDRDCEIFRSGIKRPEDDPSYRWPYHEGRRSASCGEIYDPSTGEWELVSPFEVWPEERLFAAQGKVYSMFHDTIYVKDCDDAEVWTKLYTFSLSAVGSPNEKMALCTVNDELFALMDCYEYKELTLLQSKGFGSENDQIVWERVKVRFSDELYYSAELHPEDGSEALPELGPDDGSEAFICPVQL